MTSEKIKAQINSNPVIAAVRSRDELDKAVKSPVKVIFLLNTHLTSLKEEIIISHNSEKIVLVHFDLISGLSADEEALKFLKLLMPDGIISTRSNIVKQASELGFFTIQRFFIVDSRSFETMKKALNIFRPDMIEIMPGLIFKAVEETINTENIDVIAGGLIEDKETVIKLLSIGATAVSTAHEKLWNI